MLLGPLPPLVWGGVGGAGLSRAAAAASAAAGGGGACSSCCPSSAAPAPWAPSGACAVLASNLQVKGLATGQPPTPAFLRMLVERGRRVAEFCATSVRVNGIKFLENKCLVLKCGGIKGVLSKYVELLDWTTLKVCLRDQQLLK